MKPNEICVNGHEWNLFELNSFREKIASPSQALVTAALEQGLGLRLLRTDIDEVFHPLEKEQTKTQMNLNPLSEIEHKIDHYVSYRVFFLCEAAKDAGD